MKFFCRIKYNLLIFTTNLNGNKITHEYKIPNLNFQQNDGLAKYIHKPQYKGTLPCLDFSCSNKSPPKKINDELLLHSKFPRTPQNGHFRPFIILTARYFQVAWNNKPEK